MPVHDSVAVDGRLAERRERWPCARVGRRAAPCAVARHIRRSLTVVRASHCPVGWRLRCYPPNPFQTSPRSSLLASTLHSLPPPGALVVRVKAAAGEWPRRHRRRYSRGSPGSEPSPSPAASRQVPHSPGINPTTLRRITARFAHSPLL